MANPSDIKAVAALGMEAMRINPLPGMVISRDRCIEVATECISGPQNYCWVCEIDGEVVGAVSALVHPCMLYERNQASVVQYFCKAPGEGIKLIRKFLEWARGRRSIKMIVFTLEGDESADPRIGDMLVRMGLTGQLPVYIETR